MQVILKKDGYVNNDPDDSEDFEQLLAPVDSPVHSNTIPELASMSQVLAPNSIDAEMHSISLHSPHSLKVDHSSSHPHNPEAGDKDENSDPNQASAVRSHSGQHVELQPISQTKRGLSDQHQVSFSPQNGSSCCCKPYLLAGHMWMYVCCRAT